jgi:hypothetical protein
MTAALRTPVALIVFNRPDTTRRVLAEIAKAKPPQLLLIADGPRADHPEDEEKCAATRAVLEAIDWDCEVLRNYAEVNLGCGRRPATGFEWVFQNVDEAILLEDDCVPHPTFFRFCDELLERYRDEKRVMMISGNNFQGGRKRTPHSYYFSRYTHTWGWATWRRAWCHFDLEFKLWPQLRETGWLREVLGDERAAAFWRNAFDDLDNTSDVWDYQWAFACWVQNGLAILPKSNLVTNIGWSADATHTRDPRNPSANLPVVPMEFPLSHPGYMAPEAAADRFTFEHIFGGRNRSLYLRARQRLSAFISQRPRSSRSG